MDVEYFKSYFDYISTVVCDKAKEHVEKRKSTGPPAMQSALVQFAQCEKSYYSLAFMEQKWFGRRDPLKSSYLTLSNELQGIAKMSGPGSKSITGSDAQLIGSVAEGLGNFCSYRIECIELYESAFRLVSLEDLEKSVVTLMQKHEPMLQYSILKPIVDSVVSEFKTFQRLVRTSVLIGEWNFFTSLIELHKIHQTLGAWQPLLAKEQHHTYSFRSGIFGFGERHSTSPISALYQWMAKYFQSLVSKFSFYFFENLTKQGKGEEMKAFLAKTSYDFVAKSLSFCRKLDSCFIAIGAITNENTPKPFDDTFKTTHVKLLELPTPIPDQVWPNLDVFLYNKSEEITMEKVVFLYDKQIDYTFYAAQCDPGIILCVAIAGRKSEKDSYVLNYINEIVIHLRPKRIFSLLRPGVK